MQHRKLLMVQKIVKLNNFSFKNVKKIIKQPSQETPSASYPYCDVMYFVLVRVVLHCYIRLLQSMKAPYGALKTSEGNMISSEKL